MEKIYKELKTMNKFNDFNKKLKLIELKLLKEILAEIKSIKFRMEEK